MKRRLRPDTFCTALLLAILCASCTGEQATPETGPGPDAVAGDPDGDPGPKPDAPGDIIGPHADAPGDDATEPGSDMDAPDPDAPLAIPYVTPPWDEPRVDAQFLQEDNSNPLLDAGFAPLIALAAPGPSDDAPAASHRAGWWFPPRMAASPPTSPTRSAGSNWPRPTASAGR